MRGFDHAKILSSSFHGLRKDAWHNELPFVSQKFQGGGGVLPEKLGGVSGTLLETLTLFQTKICDFPYPVSDVIKI